MGNTFLNILSLATLDIFESFYFFIYGVAIHQLTSSFIEVESSTFYTIFTGIEIVENGLMNP
jgi:hypothetical protein